MKQTNNFIDGLVIKEEPYGEKAIILHVLTAEYGVIKMKAPGGKNLKSSTHSATQLFTYSEFSVAKGKNGYLTITGAVLKTSFFNIRMKVENYALACYFSSAVSRVSTDVAAPEILRLTLNCLYALSKLDYSTETVKPFFEIKLASICGFMPDFNICPLCGKNSDTYLFDFFSLGILCQNCKSQLHNMEKSQRYFQMTPYCINLVRYICQSDIKKIFSVKINPEEHVKFRAFSEMFICNIFEKAPKTLLFYNQLMRSMNYEKLRQKQENT